MACIHNRKDDALPWHLHPLVTSCCQLAFWKWKAFFISPVWQEGVMIASMYLSVRTTKLYFLFWEIRRGIPL